MTKGIFHRTALLIGDEALNRIASKKVILFGIGGVGSWCAESLIRNGVHHLTIVDSDRVCITNVNRQLQATTKTVGMVKTDVLKERLLEINPDAHITAIQKTYCQDSSDFFKLEEYDYIIDAIDSLSNKIHLINAATRTHAGFFCSLGASLKIDPTRIRVSKFWDVRGCPFGSIIRKRMRQKKALPSRDFLCVYSDEVLENKGESSLSCEDESCFGEKNVSGDSNLVQHEWSGKKAVINGSTPYITAIFGFTLAGLIIKDMLEK